MSARPLSGSITAIVTPMHDSGAVDHQSFARLVDYQVSGGSAGLVIGGSTCESVTLGDDELLAMIRDARSGAGQHLLLVAGAGSSSTAHAVQRARQLSSSGVDALLVATPAYNRPTQEGLYRHFAAIAAESTLPVILYNVPSRTAVDLLPATVARLAQLPRIVGIKEAVPSMERIRELVSLCGSGFTVLSGDDPTARDAVANGARGVISVTANVAPAGMSAMIAAALRGESAEAARIDTSLAPLHAALGCEPNPIPSKYALARLGLMGEALRLPLTPLSDAHRPLVDAALRSVGLLSEPQRRASV